MAEISTATEHVVLLNVFDVEPENADALIKALTEATETVMRGRKGFISANLHRSLDGKRIMNYAQWESVDAFEAMRNDPKAGEHMADCAALATRFEPTLYRLEFAG